MINKNDVSLIESSGVVSVILTLKMSLNNWGLALALAALEKEYPPAPAPAPAPAAPPPTPLNSSFKIRKQKKKTDTYLYLVTTTPESGCTLSTIFTFDLSPWFLRNGHLN